MRFKMTSYEVMKPIVSNCHSIWKKISLKFKKLIYHTKATLSGVIIISDDFQSLIIRISVLMLFALNLLYIKYSIHSSYQKIFIKWFLPHPWPQITELSGTILLLFETFFQRETFFSFIIQFIQYHTVFLIFQWLKAFWILSSNVSSSRRNIQNKFCTCSRAHL